MGAHRPGPAADLCSQTQEVDRFASRLGRKPPPIRPTWPVTRTACGSVRPHKPAWRRLSEFPSEPGCNQAYACGLEQGLDVEAEPVVARRTKGSRRTSRGACSPAARRWRAPLANAACPGRNGAAGCDGGNVRCGSCDTTRPAPAMFWPEDAHGHRPVPACGPRSPVQAPRCPGSMPPSLSGGSEQGTRHASAAQTHSTQGDSGNYLLGSASQHSHTASRRVLDRRLGGCKLFNCRRCRSVSYPL